VVVRISEALFGAVRAHVEQFTEDSEEAGFLLCRVARADTTLVLVAKDWVPVPDEAKIVGSSVLTWSSAFNAQTIGRAAADSACLVLVHSHGNTPAPVPSGDDSRHAQRLFRSASRIVGGRPHGALVLGAGAASGEFWLDGVAFRPLSRLEIQSIPLDRWAPRTTGPQAARARLERQNRALGSRSDARLRQARLVVIGCSGGGSHVCQQAGFSGVGTIVPIDDDIADVTNRGRLIGSVSADVDTSLKVTVMSRLLKSIDPEITVVPVAHQFPDPEALTEMKTADVIVACVDTWRARADIDAFCRRYAIPLVDIGMEIFTKDGVLRRAHGHVTVVTPDTACNRCFLVTDDRLEHEQRERPAGYDRNPDAGDPQIVSMNGTLAAEAVSAVLDLITGYGGGRRCPGRWFYDGRSGTLERFDLPAPRPGCPNCAESRHADPGP
jgi:molybdopterin/thiamine biosynthesis adenylyltransferase